MRRTPLPGISNPNAVAHRLLVDREREPGPRMDPLTARQLATHYGSLSFDIARLVNEDPALGERIHPDGPEIWAQVVYARDHEWAETVDDVLRRRTTSDHPRPGHRRGVREGRDAAGGAAQLTGRPEAVRRLTG